MDPRRVVVLVRTVVTHDPPTSALARRPATPVDGCDGEPSWMRCESSVVLGPASPNTRAASPSERVAMDGMRISRELVWPN